MTIRLDPRLGPNENAQKYFRDYKKKQTAGQMLKKLLLEGEDEIEYLANVLYQVETAPGEQALNEMRAELKSQGYLKYYKQRERKQKPADFLRYRSSDGFEILIGRNNLHLRQHRTIPALRLKHRSGGCGTASALPKCSIRHPVLSALLA